MTAGRAPAEDRYAAIAERYDSMLAADPQREAFFGRIFRRHKVKSVLDCACGTGRDLVLFHSLGCRVSGSDLSESMLAVARRRVAGKRPGIPLRKVDFHLLPESYEARFDAVVCLSNAINELEVDAPRALESMKAVLNPGGIIVFDQGQTEATMKDPPRFAPVVNDRDLSRLFTMEYERDIMTVHVFDFIHEPGGESAGESAGGRPAGRPTGGVYDFRHSEFRIRIRLLADWRAMMDRLQLTADYYGSWDAEPYDIKASRRLIAVAGKQGA